MLDVHPPHESVHGWRDFTLHLVTITIGLLIALSLEGMVEWMHHRHLVHEAEQSLHGEIAANAKDLQKTLKEIDTEQKVLAQDVVVLKHVMADPKDKSNEHMSIDYHIGGFEDVSWKTAQSTGALAYMPYGDAETFSDIYGTQDALYAAEQQAARDAILSLAPFINGKDSDPDPTPAQAAEIESKIAVLQAQLILVDSYVKSLDGEYKHYLAAHPE